HTRFDCDWSSDVCSSDLRSCIRPPRVRKRCTHGGPRYAQRVGEPLSGPPAGDDGRRDQREDVLTQAGSHAAGYSYRSGVSVSWDLLDPSASMVHRSVVCEPFFSLENTM